MRGAVDTQWRRGPQTGLGSVAGRLLASTGKTGQRADRGGVVEDAVEVLGQAQPVAQPLHGDGFELRSHRRHAPDEGVGIEPAADEVAEDADARCGGREVGQVVGTLPVGDVGDDVRTEVADDVLQRLGVLGRRPGETVAQVPGPDLREDGVLLHVPEVVGHDVGHLVERSAQLDGGHVADASPLRLVDAGER